MDTMALLLGVLSMLESPVIALPFYFKNFKKE